MKLLFAIVAILVIAGSIFADYKWRRWIARHRDSNERPPDP
jgi:hypothetical protein